MNSAVIIQALCIFFLANCGISSAAERPKKTPKAAEKSTWVPVKDYDFYPIKIVPSPEDGVYVGHFTFVNRTSTTVSVSGFDEPDFGRFIPRFVGYEILSKEKWKDVTVGYCATGAQSFEMEPQVPYEFIVNLYRLGEPKSPTTARISVDGFRSRPFELNWKKDQKAGAFVAAKKAHFEEVRAAFAKAGFKRDMIQGDDFCQRLIESIAKATTSKNDHGFQKMTGLEVFTPDIALNGNIRIDFRSTDSKGDETQYKGMWVFTPDKFTPQWFRNEARKHIKLESSGSSGQEMILDDGTDFWSRDNKLHLSIEYHAVRLPDDEDAKAMFLKMFDNLELWLNDSAPGAQ